MKSVYIGLIVLGVLVFVLSGLFIFGGVDEENDIMVNVDEADSVLNNELVDVGGSVYDVSEEEIVDVPVNESFEDLGCELQKVQYSLKNFVEEIECVSESCDEIMVNCSVEVYNFDEGADDVFGIEFSLKEGVVELESELVSEDVAVGVSKIFGFDVVSVGVEDIENLECGIRMERVPVKWIC
ncbi:MAG: hypothetical protein V1888_00850 [archaeon]